MNFISGSIIKLLRIPYKNIKLYKLFFLFFMIKILSYFRNKKLKDILLNIPTIKDKIKSKLKGESIKLHNSLNSNYRNFKILPNSSFNKENINKVIKSMNKKTNETNKKISGVIYLGDKQHNNDMIDIFKQFSFSNPLHPDIFPEIREMEIDIVNIIKYLYKGSESCCGNVTYGGTESILLACLTYRDYYYSNYNISNPNIICFYTVHPAFDKACHYFNINIIKVKTIKEMKNKINSNTILIVGSCPEYSYGTVDPIKELSEIALKRNVSLHVDCCMGSLLIPFIEEYKHINFKLKGITSMSVDTHKYGYSLKGSSVLLFSSFEYKKYQHFINKDWVGGVYATPTMMGSKSGGIIAATWYSLLTIGAEKYKKYALEIQNNLKLIKNNFKDNNDISIISNPNLNIIAFKSKNNTLNIYNVVHFMKEKKWNLTVMQKPASFHLCITKIHNQKICQSFCNDLLKSINEAKSNKAKLDGTLALYGSSTKLENNLFIDEIIHDYIYLLSTDNCINRYKYF